MPTPVLHLIAGPNGAGKTTYYERYLARANQLPFVNADVIAAEHWPTDVVARSYDAATVAAEERTHRFEAGESFVTETVFSHPSKVDLIRQAQLAGFLVTLHIVLIPANLAVARVQNRVVNGGHDVPVEKILARHERLWSHLVQAIGMTHRAIVLDNSSFERPFTLVMEYRKGLPVRIPAWPTWTPAELLVTTDL